MTHAWFDISAGVAGDMVLGALLDAGAELAAVQKAIDMLAPDSTAVHAEQVLRAGQQATKVNIEVLVADQPHRTWKDIRAILTEAALAGQTRVWAIAAFERLALAEAHVHGISPDDVHFHEVGALDSIADLVGTCEALRLLGVTSVSASPVALGSGRVLTAHGDIPVPVPAVAELAVGWRVSAGPAIGASRLGHSAPSAHDEDARRAEHEHARSHDHAGHHHDRPAPTTTPGEPGELATPTGLALIRALASRCEPLPDLVLTTVGVGAGGKDFSGHPNVVRVLLGELVDPARPGDHPASDVIELQANVDDLDPRLWPGILDRLLHAGAVDAWLVPIQMKKGRPGFTVHALAPHPTCETVTSTLLEHTTTLGVRQVAMARAVLERVWVDVEVDGQQVPVKLGVRDGHVLRAAAEFDALADLAARTGRPVVDTAHLATAAIVEAGLIAGAEVPFSLRTTR